MKNKTINSNNQTAIITFLYALLSLPTKELRGVLVGDTEGE